MARKLSKKQNALINTRRESQHNDWLKGLVVSRFIRSAMVQTQAGELLHCKLRQNLGNLVVGDFIFYSQQQASATIEAIDERHSALTQTVGPNKVKILAANINQMIIVSALNPGIDFLMIDTLIAACELNQISPVIVLNKVDLLEKTSTLDELRLYEKLGYPVLTTCALTSAGLDLLSQQLNNQISVFVGHSGVGKSSLSNILIPNLSQQTKELTPAGLGSHTTSASHLFHLPSGGSVIDSPGIREFKLQPLTLQQAEYCFKDFKPFLGHCKFRNCTHENEPQCAIKQAVEANLIPASRFQHFKYLLNKQAS